MKTYGVLFFLSFCLILTYGNLLAQNNNYQYRISKQNPFPFGSPYPDAQEATKDYAPLIGTCDCLYCTEQKND